MSYCLNPNCHKPQNPKGNRFCQTCGSKLLLRERYRALKLISQGGFGKTFQAVDADKPSKPPCVIKQFYPQAQGTNNVAKAAQLFEQEAVRLDELGKQSQIPELLAHFEQDGRLYLVQEFIDGQNLAQELEQNGAFNETQIRQLLSSLLPVLEFVHNQQVIHRDIKPENIIRRREDGQLVVVDFGAAKFVTGTALLKTGTVIGSPQYTAPEQAVGKAIFASDLYSLGVTCLHLLTQVNPFDLFDTSEYKWVWRDFLTTPVSDALGQVLEKMVQMATKQRYQSATEVLQDLIPSVAKSQIQSAAPAAKLRNQVQTVTSPPTQIPQPAVGTPQPVEIGNEWGYKDQTGQLITRLLFDEAKPFSENMAVVRIGNKWGYIDKTGRVVIKPQFDYANSFSEGLARVKIDGKYG